MLKPNLSSDGSVLVVVMALVVGFLYLAIIDHTFRQPFANLANVAVGGYFAMLIPPSKSK